MIRSHGGAPAAERSAGAQVPYRLRKAATEDVAAVTAVEAATFSTPWSAATFRSLVDREDTEFLVAESRGGELVGYAILWSVDEEGELANVAVREDWRGLGLGAALLDRALHAAWERGVRRVFLEVRDSNARAIRMYETRGFQQVGVRRRYYRAPREDARVLMKRLEG